MIDMVDDTSQKACLYYLHPYSLSSYRPWPSQRLWDPLSGTTVVETLRAASSLGSQPAFVALPGNRAEVDKGAPGLHGDRSVVAGEVTPGSIP